MTLHIIEPVRASLHGHFSVDLAPILTAASGDTLRFRTLDGGWGLEPPRTDGSPRRLVEPRDPRLDSGHALCGPVAVRDAEPGMVLEIGIEAIEPGPWGWTRAGGWKSPWNERLGVADGVEHLVVWTLDPRTATARDPHGRAVPIRPFMGVIGMPPPEPGIHSTIPPRNWGGNMDCKELVAGSRLLLPVPVRGALLSTGDGHAAQGDGEVSGLAIECPMDRVDLSLKLHDDIELDFPVAETPAGTIALGFGATLDDAEAGALEGMLRILMARLGVSRKHALALASVAVDLRITQVVNGTVGAHAVLPPGALRA